MTDEKMSLSEYIVTFNAQHGGCVICGAPLVRALALDGAADTMMHRRDDGLVCCRHSGGCDCDPGGEVVPLREPL